MNILFVHQNMPGQFKHLAPALAADPANRVVFVTKRGDVDLARVRRVTYPAPRNAHASTHHYVRLYENSVLHGQQVVRVCMELGREGFRPDAFAALTREAGAAYTSLVPTQLVRLLDAGGDVLDALRSFTAVLLGGATALLPVYARDILHTGPWGLGVLRAAPAAGALAGSIWLAHFPLRQRAGNALFGG